MKDRKLLCKIALISCGYGIFSDSVIVPVLSQIYSEFPNATQFLKNFIVTGGYLFSLIASILAGIMLRYISKRKLLLVGAVCFSVGGIGGFFCTSLEGLAIMRTLDGISDGILAVTALSMITDLYSEEKERATMIGLYGAVSAICGVLLSFFAGLVAEFFPWRCVFLLNLISICSIIFIFLSVPKTALLERIKNRKRKKTMSLKLLGMIVGYFISSAMYCILFVFVDLYVQEKSMGTSVLSGTISSMGSLVTFLTGTTFSMLYMKMKNKFSYLCYGGLGISFFLLWMIDKSWIAVVLFAFASFFYSYLYSYYPMKMSWIVPKEDISNYMSVFNATYSFACFASAYIPYFVLKIINGTMIYESFLPCAILLLTVSVISSVLGKEHEAGV